MSAADPKKRGPRLPFGQLTGVWTELAQTLRGLKDGTIKDVEQAKARVYTLQTMLGVVDRLIEQRAMDAMQEEIAALREAIGGAGKVVPTVAAKPMLPERSVNA